MIISIHAGKIFDKIQHFIYDKNLSKLGIEKNFLNLTYIYIYNKIKNMYKTLQLASQ